LDDSEPMELVEFSRVIPFRCRFDPRKTKIWLIRFYLFKVIM